MSRAVADRLCACGCGGFPSRGSRFLRGHNKAQIKFKILVALRQLPEDECWEWPGKLTTDGYGVTARQRAHRWVYERLVGPIPDGLQLDHLCRNRACVNPVHLEPVTNAENVARGIAGQVNGGRQRAITHCPQGHAYSPDNTSIRANGHRVCKACHRDQERARYARLRTPDRSRPGLGTAGVTGAQPDEPVTQAGRPASGGAS